MFDLMAVSSSPTLGIEIASKEKILKKYISEINKNSSDVEAR